MKERGELLLSACEIWAQQRGYHIKLKREHNLEPNEKMNRLVKKPQIWKNTEFAIQWWSGVETEQEWIIQEENLKRHTGEGAERGNSEPHCLRRFKGHGKQDMWDYNCEDCQETGAKSLERETGMA